MVAPQGRQQDHQVQREEPIRYGFFKRDYTMVWLVGLFLLGCAVLGYSARIGVSWAGLLFVVGLVIAARVFIFGSEPTRLAKRSQKAVIAVEGYLGHNLYLEDLSSSTAYRSGQSRVIKKLGKVDVEAVPLGNGNLGIYFDRRYNTAVVAVALQFHSTTLDDERTLERRMDGWADLHDRLSRQDSLIHRIVFRDWTYFGFPTNAQRIVEEIRRNSGTSRKSPPNEAALLRKLESQGDEGFKHRTTMILSFYRPDCKKAASLLDDGMEELVARELQTFLRLALGAERGGNSPIGLKSAQPLTRNGLLMELLTSLDPVAGQKVWQRWQMDPNDDLELDPDFAIPSFADFDRADYCQIGRTCWMGSIIKEPERRNVLPMDFWELERLKVPKVISVVYYGMNARKAQSGAELRRGSSSGMIAERMRHGHDVASRHGVATEEAREHEHDIALTRRHVGRKRIHIGLYGQSPLEVRLSMSRLENAGFDARHGLVTLDGRHHDAVSASMPLARGLALPNKRGGIPSRIAYWIDH